MKNLANMLPNAFNHLERVSKREITPCDVMTGFKELDRNLCGFNDGELIVIGSRPGIGKSSFILNCALKNAQSQVPVIFYSFDFTETQIVRRLMSLASGINLTHIGGDKLNEEELESLMVSTQGLQKLPLYLESKAPQEIEDLCKHIAEQVKETGAKIIYIDYLQCLDCKNKDSVEDRFEQISLFSRSLKALARDLEIPIVVTSQLDNNCQEPSQFYQRPQMNDLQNCGTICSDANLILLLWRPELYYHSSENPEGFNILNQVEVNVIKNNNGFTRYYPLEFDKNTCRFSDWKNEHGIDSVTMQQK